MYGVAGENRTLFCTPSATLLYVNHEKKLWYTYVHHVSLYTTCSCRSEQRQMAPKTTNPISSNSRTIPIGGVPIHPRQVASRTIYNAPRKPYIAISRTSQVPTGVRSNIVRSLSREFHDMIVWVLYTLLKECSVNHPIQLRYFLMYGLEWTYTSTTRTMV